MKYYSKCPICGYNPSFKVRKKISLDENCIIKKIQIEEFLTEVSKEKSPEEILSVCMKCRLVYREKFFCDRELQEIYNKAYRRMEKRISQVGVMVYDDAEFLGEYSRMVYGEVKDIERRYQSKIVDIYDIGGRDGFMMNDLAEDDYRCTVFDPIPCEAYSEKILKKDIRLSEIESKQTADLILLCDVLSHCVNPREALAVCYEILREGGFLYIQVPYDLATVFDWLLFMRRRGENLSIDLTHFSFFSLRSLTYLVEAAGFKCETMHFSKLPKFGNTLITILGRKVPASIHKPDKTLSFGFDLLRSGHFTQLFKRAFKRFVKYFNKIQ